MHDVKRKHDSEWVSVVSLLGSLLLYELMYSIHY